MPRKKPTRNEATELRHTKFAEAMFRLGSASAALREVYPNSRQWTGPAVNKRAYDLAKLPVVQKHLELLKESAKLDTIASRSEIARLLAEIMRGNVMQPTIRTHRASDGSSRSEVVESPPPINSRIKAAKELERLLPSVSPTESDEAKQQDEVSTSLDETLAAIRLKRKTK